MSEQDCPTCGPTTVEQHPRRPGVTRCGNCKEWLTRLEHRPVGAYLPVGQLDGDCACGRGAYPCPDTPPTQPAADETEHDCETCRDCIHDGHKCCGCYDGACCCADHRAARSGDTTERNDDA